MTLVTHKRMALFGEVIDGNMHLNEFGRIAWEEWFRTSRIRPNVELVEEEFVVMPNHIHGIIWIFEGDVQSKGDLVYGKSDPLHDVHDLLHGMSDPLHGKGDLRCIRQGDK